MKKFRLYIAKPSQRAIKNAKKYDYHMITPEYILVYADTTGISGFAQIKAENLCKRDLEWVNVCNDQIIREEIENKCEVSGGMMGFLDRFQKALEEEKQKLEGEQHENNVPNNA